MMLEDKTNTEEIKEEKLGLELSDVKDHNVNDGVTDEVFFDDEDDGADERSSGEVLEEDERHDASTNNEDVFESILVGTFFRLHGA